MKIYENNAKLMFFMFSDVRPGGKWEHTPGRPRRRLFQPCRHETSDLFSKRRPYKGYTCPPLSFARGKDHDKPAHVPFVGKEALRSYNATFKSSGLAIDSSSRVYIQTGKDNACTRGFAPNIASPDACSGTVRGAIAYRA